ncbi:MAG: type II toxin-antitoxin system VapC family toxin [Terriglobales bacterium]
MVVLDASALLRLLLKPEDEGELPRQEIHVPHLCDAEVAHTLRRLCLHGVVDAPRARILIQALEDGDWERHPHFPYLERAAARPPFSGRPPVGRAAAETRLAATRARSAQGASKLPRRAWELRHNFIAYDALYVALAEGLACPLLTFDRRLAGAARRFARVELRGAAALLGTPSRCSHAKALAPWEPRGSGCGRNSRGGNARPLRSERVQVASL